MMKKNNAFYKSNGRARREVGHTLATHTNTNTVIIIIFAPIVPQLCGGTGA